MGGVGPGSPIVIGEIGTISRTALTFGNPQLNNFRNNNQQNNWRFNQRTFYPSFNSGNASFAQHPLADQSKCLTNDDYNISQNSTVQIKVHHL